VIGRANPTLGADADFCGGCLLFRLENRHLEAGINTMRFLSMQLRPLTKFVLEGPVRRHFVYDARQ
jgi:hypothetical protein